MNEIPLRQSEPAGQPASFDPRRIGRILLYTAIITFCLAAVASIGVILFGEFGGTEGRILVSSFSIAAYSLAGLIATARFGRDPKALAPLGLTCAGIGLVMTLILIWADPDSDFLFRVTISAMVLAGAFALANLLLPDPERDDPAAALLAATLAVNAILTAMIVLPVLFDGNPEGSFYWKSVAVLAVLLVLGTLVVPVVRKIKDGAPASAPMASAPVPAWMEAGGGTLELRYRGRSFQVLAEPAIGDLPGFTSRTWLTTGLDRRLVPISPDVPAASDPHTALGLAVQAIARAVDEGQI